MSNRLNPCEAVKRLSLALPQCLAVQMNRLDKDDFGPADVQAEVPSWSYLVQEVGTAIRALEDHSYAVPSIITDIVKEGPDYYAVMGRRVKDTNLSAALKRRKQYLAAVLGELQARVEGTKSEDETVEVKHAVDKANRRPNVNTRMIDTLSKEPESKDWSIRQWAERLECRVSTVHDTPTWTRLMDMHDKAGWERRGSRSGKRVNKKPRLPDEN
jgi:hypothetical protein